MAQHLTQKEFLAISREVKEALKSHKYAAAAIAKRHHVSAETVRRVRTAKTWNGFQALKAARHTSPKISKAEKQVIANAADADFASELKKIEERYATKESVAEVMQDIGKFNSQAKWRNADAMALAAKANDRSKAALVVSAVSLVLSIIALAI